MITFVSLLWLAPPVGPVERTEPVPPTEPPAFEERDTPELRDPVAEALAVVPGGLTAEMAAKRAGKVSPTVEGKRADADLAQARVDQVTYAAVPTLNLSASYTRFSPLTLRFGSGALVGAANAGALTVGPCPGGTGECVLDAGGTPVGAATFNIPVILDQFNTQASLVLPISDYALRLVNGLKAARQNRKAAEMLTNAERLKVETDARIAYYQWVRSVAALAVEEDALVRARTRAQEAAASFSAGSIARVDVMRIDTLVANAENAVVQAKALVELNEETLATQMGDASGNYRVGEDVLAETSRDDTRDIDSLVDRAIDQRLEMRALLESNQALKNAVKAERSGFYPRFDLFGDAVYANPNQRYFPLQNKWRGTWAVGARITYSINAPLLTRARVKELKAQGRGLDAQYESLRRALKLEVTGAYLDRERAYGALMAARKAKESSQEAYRATSALFRVGKATATELIVAEADFVNAQLLYVLARVGIRASQTRLRYATGDMPLAR